jgi:hypothetical protein
LNTAFDEEIGTPEPVSTQTDTPAEPEPVSPAAPEKTEAAPVETPKEEEPTGDVLLDKLTPDELAAVKQDPKLRKIYSGLMKSYTPKMQALAEQQKLWDALNNPETRKAAAEALARSVGLEIKPTDQPQRDKAAEVADNISEEWSKVVGPEAALQLRPLIEKTALAAVQGTIRPAIEAAEFVHKDAANRQAEAQTSQFRTLAKEKGWDLTPEIESKMVQLGLKYRPADPIKTVGEGVDFMKNLYRMATADTAESDMEKRILERMQKAAQTAEPGRGIPATGREKRTNITKEMDLNQAMDVAFEEEVPGLRMRS